MADGAITLEEICGRIATLRVLCGRCDRRGQYSLQSLISHHGANMRLPDLAWKLADDCPKRHGYYFDRCSVFFPELVDLFPVEENRS